jgi:hypothetical protein
MASQTRPSEPIAGEVAEAFCQHEAPSHLICDRDRRLQAQLNSRGRAVGSPRACHCTHSLTAHRFDARWRPSRASGISGRPPLPSDEFARRNESCGVLSGASERGIYTHR